MKTDLEVAKIALELCEEIYGHSSSVEDLKELQLARNRVVFERFWDAARVTKKDYKEYERRRVHKLLNSNKASRTIIDQ